MSLERALVQCERLRVLRRISLPISRPNCLRGKTRNWNRNPGNDKSGETGKSEMRRRRNGNSNKRPDLGTLTLGSRGHGARRVQSEGSNSSLFDALRIWAFCSSIDSLNVISVYYYHYHSGVMCTYVRVLLRSTRKTNNRRFCPLFSFEIFSPCFQNKKREKSDECFCVRVHYLSFQRDWVSWQVIFYTQQCGGEI